MHDLGTLPEKQQIAAILTASREAIITAYSKLTGQGRPRKSTVCEWCGELFGAREMRAHLPSCKKNQKIIK
jgi:hypothetical protein